MRQIIASIAGAASLVALSSGAYAQYAPTIPASPGPGKPMAYFQQDDSVCQQWANQQVAYAQSQAGNQVVGGAVAGAVGGALLGGLLGGGRGAAIGAGAGAVTGGAAGTAEAQDTAYYGQQRFDQLYQQCMVGRGNQIGYAPPPPSYQQPPPPPPPSYRDVGPSSDE